MSEHREPKLLGNGKLTVSARLSSVFGATAVAALIGLASFIGPKAWDMLVSIHENMNKLTLAVELGSERTFALKERVDKIEDRLVFLEQKGQR